MMDYPPFGEISIGEPDANSEYFAALRAKRRPIFLDSFYSPPHFPFDEFATGEKYIIFGQKGTGKTSVLRHIRDELGAESSDFLIFKRAFLEEVDLTDSAKIPLMVDEENLGRFKHHHHTVKRLLILLLLRRTFDIRAYNEAEEGEEVGDQKSLIAKVAASPVGDAIKLGLDSIGALFQAVGVDLKKISDSRVLIDAGKAVKRSNDSLLSYLIRRLKRLDAKRVALFVDELHFAYRSEDSLQQDAILVRDTILAVQSLNDRFAEEGLPATIYLAIRSEYLEHPIIATADINHAVESVGYELTYSNFLLRNDHPLFEMMAARFAKTIGASFNREQFLRVYMQNLDPVVFLERSWSKPRDIVRFFKCARKLYPQRTVLSVGEINAVWRNYAQEAWKEIKSSASPFMSPVALTEFERALSAITPGTLDGSLKFDVDSFGDVVRPAFDIAKGANREFYSFEHFIRLLYILGIFSTRRHDAHDQEIYHSYHRGNRNFHLSGRVMIHPTVLKALG